VCCFRAGRAAPRGVAGLVHPVAVVRQPGQQAGRGRVKPPGFGGLTRTGRSARLTAVDGDPGWGRLLRSFFHSGA
jgi:hypothetical protein